MPVPIAIFSYRRPLHLARVIDALGANLEASETLVYLFSDGARDQTSAVDVGKVRDLIATIDGFKEVRAVYRECNLGLARNITSGVTQVLAEHESVIVVEDDICVGPYFLRYMNDALEFYRNEPRVGSISGYCYPADSPLPETFLIRGADCWGWATWRDRWKYYEPAGQELLKEIRRRKLTHAFDFGGAMGFTQMLEDQIAGKNDSWAVRWHASCFLRDLLILYPGRSLVQNIGIDGTGTHSKSVSQTYDVQLSAGPVSIGSIAIEESREGWMAFHRFFRRSQPRPSALRRVVVAVLELLGLREFVRRVRSRPSAGL
jgi:hypothetical protein